MYQFPIYKISSYFNVLRLILPEILVTVPTHPGQRKAVRMTLDFHFSPPNTAKHVNH